MKTLIPLLIAIALQSAASSYIWVAQVEPRGKLIGLFDTYESAAAACTTSNACVFPMELNRDFGTNFVETGVIYPKR